jgi:(1->4)-alpha-D-glucan 1-alpha-D-glucosylmutase
VRSRAGLTAAAGRIVPRRWHCTICSNASITGSVTGGASSDIGYRRFFDINTLAGLRIEDAATFEAIHALVKRLIEQDKLQGLRLDHIDGLRDPAQYFQRLRRLIRQAQGDHPSPFYMAIEKILGEHERLPAFSGVHGTTGYEWMNVITHVLIDGSGLGPLDEIWRQISNQSPRLEPILKLAPVLETLLTTNSTSDTPAGAVAGHYHPRLFTDSLRRRSKSCCTSVYRTT